MGVRAPTSCTLKRGRLEWLGQGTQVRARWKQKCKATTHGTELGAAGKVREDVGSGGSFCQHHHTGPSLTEPQGCEAVGSMDQPSFTGWYWVGGGLDTGLLGGTCHSPLPDKLLTLVFPP